MKKLIYVFESPFNLFVVVFIVMLMLLNSACKKKSPTGPPQDQNTNTKLTLTVEDVSCTEAWLHLHVTDTLLPGNISLMRNNTTIMNFLLSKADTTLYVDSLLPSKSCLFTVNLAQGNGKPQESNKVTVVTLDSTSHNLTWQTWTFGEHSSSSLNDVAIINENNIWAVGEIYLKDSLGNTDPQLYNLIKYDGTSWKIERIYFTNHSGQTFLSPIKSIFSFSKNDVWLGMDQLIHWDGTRFIEYELSPTVFHSWINKIWGNSSNDLYIVGNSGNIAHFDGTSWQKIQSGTDFSIYDILGTDNPITGEKEILAVASRPYIDFEKQILMIKNNNVTKLSTLNIDWPIVSIWFKPGFKYYVCGSGLYVKENVMDINNWRRIDSGITDYVIPFIRGLNYNDIFSCGAYGEIIHFNGVSWKSYINDTYMNGSYVKIYVTNKIVAAIGWEGIKAKIIIAHR